MAGSDAAWRRREAPSGVWHHPILRSELSNLHDESRFSTSPLPGDASSDARSLIASIRSGRVFTVIDAIAGPGFLDVESDAIGQDLGDLRDSRRWRNWSWLQDGHDSFAVAGRSGGALSPLGGRHDDLPSCASRSEFRMRPGRRRCPWLVSNPIYFRPPSAEPAPAASASSDCPTCLQRRSGIQNTNPESVAKLTSFGGQVTFDYTLAAGERKSQFAAAVGDIRREGTSVHGDLLFGDCQPPGSNLRADALRRGRAMGPIGLRRFDDTRGRECPSDRLVPADFQKGAAPDTTTADSLLFVADLTNDRPGDANTIRISNLRFEK